MPCFHPHRAWKTSAGITFRRPTNDDLQPLALPCGGCLGCRMAKARDWAVRCSLELKDHRTACWVTLTYDDKYLPLTLDKPELSSWLKRLRARHSDATIRFFGCGEYGEKNNRPHYHVILYGLPPSTDIQATWRKGFARVDPLSPAAIAYVAGYVTKKQQRPLLGYSERSDPETGEVYTYQPPFNLMSRRPGIGSSARQHWTSWKRSAIHYGSEVPVPRYLHEAFKSNANPFQIEDLEWQKALRRMNADHNPARLVAAETIAHAKHQLQSEKRSL